MKYSIIVPVYNRPDECDELLASLCRQLPLESGEPADFEVIIVEDGSAVPCEEVVKRYAASGEITSKSPKNFSNAGQDCSQAAQDSSEAGQDSSEAGQGCSQAGQGSSEAGQDCSQAGQGSSEAGQGCSQTAQGSSEAAQGCSQAAQDSSEAGQDGDEGKLDVHYFAKENSGPGQTRNYGVERAQGEYVLILDSDVVLPEGYLRAVDAELKAQDYPEAFGGPDRAHESFTSVQKAINYGMTSFFTTGGIRGGKAKLDKFFPRSFNMGIRRDVYLKLEGFSKMRFGEDVDFSYRLVESGARCRLFPSAWVYHKRRANFRQFFKQVHNSGIARINLTKRHPGTLKLVHMLPALFTVGVALCLFICLEAGMFLLKGAVSEGQMAEAMNAMGLKLLIIGLTPLKLYGILIFLASTLANRSLWVGLLSVIAAYVQLLGYGTGFIRCWWKRCVLGMDEFEAFKKNFYK